MSQNKVPNPSRQWNYQPDLPIQTSPVFSKPWKFMAVAKWVFRSWFPISENLIVLSLALVSWIYFHPSLEQCREFGWQWISLIYIRNLVLMMLVAGGLHVYFYVFKAQARQKQYDARPLARQKRSFTFNDQVKDNMFWSCASGVTVWTAYEVIMMWSMANGYVPSLPENNPLLWAALLIFLIPIWETVYFFFIHRALHWPFLYRTVHALHHRNTNVGPWSGLSMHPLEHIIYLGSVMVHFIIPANPLIIIYHLQHYCLTAATTHTGFEGITVRGRLILGLGTYHHQLHHRYFECNYGGLEVPWDKWLGYFHDGTPASHKRFQEKQLNRQNNNR